MTKFVPYLADEIIEGDAALLLAEYAHARGVTIEPPIPIEDIVEKHLNSASSSTTPTNCLAFRAIPSVTPISSAQFSSTRRGS